MQEVVVRAVAIAVRMLMMTWMFGLIDTARLPMFPVILIDDTLIVGHYAHSSVIPLNGLWITIEHPKILTMYQDLLDGKEVKYETAEEGAILRYLEELMVE